MRRVCSVSTLFVALVACGGGPSVGDAPETPDAPTTTSDLRGIFFAERPERAVSRLTVRQVEGDGFVRVGADRVFAAGDAIRFEIESTGAARFQILHATGDGPLRAIWPPPEQPELGRIDAGGSRVVPSAPGLIVFDAAPATERFRVVLVADPPAAPRAAERPSITQIFLRAGETNAGVDRTSVQRDGPWLYFEAADAESVSAVDLRLVHR